jgi:hypothetical protein
MELSVQQRNEIFTALVKSGMNPEDCHLQLRRQNYSQKVRLLHKPTRSYFDISEDRVDRAEQCYWFRGRIGTATDWDRWYGRGAFEELTEAIRTWVQEVDYLINNADLWEEMRRQSRDTANNFAHTAVNNLPFDEREQAQIAARVHAIKQHVRVTYELSSDQLSGIDRKLDEIKEASERVGRKDWLMMLQGAAFGLIVQDSVPPHIVQNIVTMALQGLAHFIGIGASPLPLPPAT